MKKGSLLIIILLLFVASSIKAQSITQSSAGLTERIGIKLGSKKPDFGKKGSVMFNPQLLNLSYQNISLGESDFDEKYKLSQVGLSVQAGYAIIDNLFIVGQIAGQSLKFEESTVNFFTLGAGARYYLDNLFVGAGVLMNSGKVESDWDDDDFDASGGTSTTLFGLQAEVGYSIFLLPTIALEPSISYNTKIAGGDVKSGGTKTESNVEYNQFGVNLGVSIYF